MTPAINITRDLWADPAFRPSAMSQREAWIWMIAEAASSDQSRRIGSHDIDLRRGQFAASSRSVAAVFGWSEPKVRRFWDALENRRMIERVADAGVTVVTICKYGDYQGASRVDDAEQSRDPTQLQRVTPAPGESRKAEIKPPPTPDERLKYFADLVNSDRPLRPDDISTALAHSLLDAGLVSMAQLRKRGIAR